MQRRIDALKDRYLALARTLGAPAKSVHFHETPTNSGAAHVEIAGTHLYYVVTERGIELERRHTEDPDTLLYWLMRDLTFEVASDYEMKHRRDDGDFRRQLFVKQLELLGRLKTEWRTAYEDELRSTLNEYPFRDEKHPSLT